MGFFVGMNVNVSSQAIAIGKGLATARTLIVVVLGMTEQMQDQFDSVLQFASTGVTDFRFATRLCCILIVGQGNCVSSIVIFFCVFLAGVL